MNPLIENRFDQLEGRLLESAAVRAYDVLRREVSLRSGQFRVRVELRDGGLLELFEYVQVTSEGEIVARKYRYHWQDVEEQMIPVGITPLTTLICLTLPTTYTFLTAR